MKLNKELINKITHKRKYLSKIYIRITLLVFALITTLSAFAYYFAQTSIRTNTYEANKQILFQMEYNIKNMDNMIKQIASSTFHHEDINSIMKNPKISEDDYYDIGQKLLKLKTNTLNFNPFIHSIYIYNNYNKTYFGTYYRMLTLDKTLNEALSKYKSVPKMMPIARKFDTGYYGNNKLESVFTYVMYDSTDMYNQLDGAVFVNVKEEWVISSIKTIAMASSSNSDNVYILTSKSEVIGEVHDDQSMNTALQQIRTRYIDKHIENGETFGFFSDKIGESKYFFTFLFINQADWIILKVQPYSEVFKSIYNLRSIFILITMLFILIATIVAFNVSKGIYKPVNSLVEEITTGIKNTVNTVNTMDEIQFLRGIFRQSIDVMDSAKNDKDRNINILRTYYIRKLLIDSAAISTDDMIQAVSKANIAIKMDKNIAVCVIKIDQFKKFNEQYDEKEKRVLRFAILNIAGEVVSRGYVNDTLDVQKDHLVMLINTGTDRNTFFYDIRNMFMEVQSHLLNYFNFSISVALSDIGDNAATVSENYMTALNYSSYKFIHGRGSIITGDMLEKNIGNNQIGYSNIHEKKLIDAIKLGNIGDIEEIITTILNEISQQKYNHILLSIMNMVNTIENTLAEINQRRVQQLAIDFSVLNNEILEIDSIDEFKTQLIKLLKEGIEFGNFSVDERHRILIDTINEIVYANYSDSSFCVSQIADILKLSVAYISKVYRNYARDSLSSFINMVRVGKAAELLEKTDLSVNQVMLRVGIDNESNFYRNFKKEFGTTPKEYVLKMQLNKSISN